MDNFIDNRFNMIDEPKKPEPINISKEPYYKNEQVIKLKKGGFVSYFWIGFAILWTVFLIGGSGYLGYFCYTNHINPLTGIVQVMVNNPVTVPVNNTNNNYNNFPVDIPTPQINNSFIIYNQINMTNSS